MKSLNDTSFQYVRSDRTDLRKVFERVRRRMREEQEARTIADSGNRAKVSPLKLNKTAAF